MVPQPPSQPGATRHDRSLDSHHDPYIATEEEKVKLWPLITSVFEGYARYQERTERSIPVVIL